MEHHDKSKDLLIIENNDLRNKIKLLEAAKQKDTIGSQYAQDVLYKERILLRTLIDNIPDSIYCKDLSCRKTLANLADVNHLKAKSEADVLGKDDFEFYPKEIAEKFFTDDQLVMQTGKSVINREEYVLDEYGQKRWLLTSKIPLREKNNKIFGLLGIGRDITQRKQAELLLLEQNEEIEAQNEEYQLLNEELRQTNEELYIAKEKTQKSEERYKLRESYLSAIIENQPGLLWLKDINSKFLFVNTAFSISCGLENPASVVGKSDLDIWPQDLALKYIDDDKKVINSGKSYIVEEKIFDKGEIKWFDTFKTPIFDETGKVIGTTGYSHDITERKQSELLLKEKAEAIESQNEKYLQINEELNKTNQELIQAKEKAEESDRLKTAFLQNMSHEIRTPMNAIMGFAELIKEQYNNKPKLEKFSDIIIQRCNDLLDLINEILDISKIESSQLPVNYEECDLNFLFNELTLFFAEQQKKIGKQHIKLNLQSFCNQTDNFILVDAVKLKQIFINLISNAFKFTDEGTIEGGCKFDKIHNLVFYVSDTGIGIPFDKQKVIFDRFVQLNQDSNRIIGGTGLGLSIVKGLVELLGGEIFLESEPGKGSTFTFTIAYKTSQAFPLKSLISEEQVELIFPDKNILIVEDDPYNMEYLKEILTESNINFLIAVNGKEAIQISLTNPIDLILMDISLPDLDGYEATRQIRKHKPDLKIIAQTAYTSNEEKQKSFNAGCIDYISKPTNKHLLLSMIKKHLQN